MDIQNRSNLPTDYIPASQDIFSEEHPRFEVDPAALGLSSPQPGPAAKGQVADRLPGGTVTFLFTDIEGSTPLWESQPDRMRRALEVHNLALHQAISAQGGVVFKFVGDAFQAAFPTAHQALFAAITAQHSLQSVPWEAPGPLRVRMGLNTGEAHLAQGGGDYAVSHTLNRVARIMSAGHGGQILLSSETAELCASYLPPGVRLKDLGKHSLKGLARAERIYQVLAPGLREGFPPLASLHRPEHNLPVQFTNFIGREKEINQVKELIELHPLVTLTGSGGVGKTRLSLQVAERVLELFADGVWYVELAQVSDPDLVPQTITTTLGLRAETDRSLSDTLAHYFRDRQVLLVLDNCEHLLEACARLAEGLLKNAARLKLLVSSREALGIGGESAYRVPSMAAPDPHRLLPLAEFVEFEAVRLFTARARSVLPNFQVDERNAPTIAQICRRLDGIPLALELAAARMNMLTTAQLASRLDDAFRLLTGGSRTALPRQQTLRAATDWSYQLLSEKEQRLLRRLAVFAGGANLEAIEAICSGAGLEKDEILDLLGGLANKSMVAVERIQHVETRYRLLETVRQFGRELLARQRVAGEEGMDTLESAVFFDRALDYFLEMAETIEPQLKTATALDRLETLNREVDNLRASLAWALDGEEAGRIGAGLRLASSLYILWFTQNYFLEGYTWLVKGLSALPRDDPAYDNIRAKACFTAGYLQFPIERFKDTGRWFTESLEIYQKIGDAAGQAMAQSALGDRLAWIGDTPIRARELCQQSLETARKLNDPWLLAWVLSGFGTCAERQGDLSLARQSQEESLSIYERLGDRIQVGLVYLNIGWLSLYQGDATAAISYFRKALAAGQTSQFTWLIASALCGFGLAAYYQNDFVSMEVHFRFALDKHRMSDDRYGLIFALRGIGAALKRLGQPRPSAALYLDSLPQAQEANDTYGVYAAIAGIGGVVLLLGDTAKAARLLGAVEALFSTFYKPLDAWEQREYDRDVSAAKEALSTEEFSRFWAEGHLMNLETAIQAASILGVEDQEIKEQPG